MSSDQGESHVTEFEKVLRDFKDGLKRRDVENFRLTTFKDLKVTIGELQQKQHSQRRLRALSRLKPFLEAMEQFGKVIEVFCNSSMFVPFVWGPAKLLLQIASTYEEAFSELVDTYEHIGECLPLLEQYQDLFHAKPHMIRVLSLMYGDILNFHRLALRYFQQPIWKQLFQATWKTYKSRFSGVLSNMARHRGLIESQASLSQIEDFQEVRRFDDLRQSQSVYSWLRPSNVMNDQYHHIKLRASYPGTGRWLLQNQTFKEWFDPQYPTIPPLLWLTGIPGGGKTVLASLVIEEAQNLSSRPTVLFFYCKHANSDRDNFVAVARSLLSQLLKQDDVLLPYFYQKCCASGEAVLTSIDIIEDLFLFALDNCKRVYIILDGIDECSREERKKIVQWFRKLVEDLPSSDPDRYRCMFVSQEDGVARKDFSGLANIKIKIEDNKSDTDEYCRIESDKVKHRFNLPDNKAASIMKTVASSVGGMFLFAKLVWINLSGQTSMEGLERELEPGTFPTGLNEAYARIMVRIDNKPVRAQREEARMLLGWLVCAKRPLKWFEIQAMKSIDPERQSVDLERRRFLVDPKDLCESLVELRSDDMDPGNETLELVHSSAKFFLIEESEEMKPYIVPAAEDLKLATLCVEYLNFPLFVVGPTKGSVLRGDYGFMEYAVLYWLRHLEAGVMQSDEHEQLMKHLAESLGIFIQQHWNSPTVHFPVSRRNSDKLQFFKIMEDYEKLEQTVVSTRKQLSYFGKLRDEEIALRLIKIVQDIRKILESIVSSATDPALQQDMQQKYGSNLFKCPRLSCQFFTTGFSTAPERDKHVGKHERPFRCDNESCPGFIFGFSTEKERTRHMNDTHSMSTDQADTFPTDDDIESSRQRENVQEILEDSAPPAVQESDSESESEPEPEPDVDPMPRQPSRKRQKTEYKCEHCMKLFTKKYNWQSHLLSHEQARPHKCHECGRGFARLSDLNRHIETHRGTKDFTCGGTLRSGQRWGCGKSFSRLDILRTHFKSRTGQECIRPLNQED